MGYMSPTPGNVSIISQSGSTGVVLCSELRGMGVGIRRFVSSGNEASITFEDYLECFLADEMTKVVGGFLEGLRDAGRFVDICRKNHENKPIIILKTGTTPAGARAASSHTASLSGMQDIYQAAFRQYGIVRARGIDDLLNLVRGFSYMKPPRGNRVAILPAAGGVGVLTADACARAGLDVAGPSQDLVDRISEHLPKFWSRSNPFDPTGVQDLTLFPRILELVLESDEYDCAVTHVIEIQSLLEKYFPRHDEGKRIKEMMMGRIASMEESVARQQIRIAQEYGKPVVWISHCYPNSELFKVFDEQKVVVVRTPDDAAYVLKSLYEHAKDVA
jgi:acyl-CoA synthetase (NDP forming)